MPMQHDVYLEDAFVEYLIYQGFWTPKQQTGEYAFCILSAYTY